MIRTERGYCRYKKQYVIMIVQHQIPNEEEELLPSRRFCEHMQECMENEINCIYAAHECGEDYSS